MNLKPVNLDTQFEKYADAEIISRVNEGDINLYESLISRYVLYLYIVGSSYMYNHVDTDEIMLDAYIDIFCSLKKLQNPTTFKTCLTRIILNGCYQKKQKLSFKNEI